MSREKLGLTVEPVSTQIIPRDRHAIFFAVLGVIAGSIEHLATEIRHLQRTEVREAEEFFTPGQKGSSAMPHKRNPVLSENLTGLARMVRAAVIAGAGERGAVARARHLPFRRRAGASPPTPPSRSISRWRRLAGRDRQAARLSRGDAAQPRRYGGLVHSQRVLLALTAGRHGARGGLSAPCSAMPCGCGRRARTSSPLLKADPEVAGQLRPAKLGGLFDLGYHIRHVDTIFKRVFGEG